MKKLFLLLAVFLTACSITPFRDADPAEGPAQGGESSQTAKAAGALLSEEEAYAVFTALEQEALPVLYWYMGEATEDLDISDDPAHDPYYKVNQFQSIEEMKAASEAVFTREFLDQYCYDHAFGDIAGAGTAMYREIEGELYRNVQMGGMGWPWQASDDYYIPYIGDDRMVVAVNTVLPGDETAWYNFLLKRENGLWKLDTYYEYNPHMEYMDAFPRARTDPITHAVSSWFCARDWTDANQLDPNSLVNFYLYTYLSDVGQYDYETGYQVSAADVMEGLSAYLKDLRLETLTAVNELSYANARYDADTDSFYFDIMFDRADYIVTGSRTDGAATTLEIMVIGKSGRAAYTAFLELEVDGGAFQFTGNRCGEDFRDA